MSSGSGGRGDASSQCLERLLDAVYDFGSAEKKKPKKKRKKRQRCEEEEEEELTVAPESLYKNAEIPDGQKHKTEESGPNVRQETQVEVVTFQDPRKKRKTSQALAQGKPAAPQITEKKESSPQELSLEKARLEVHRFGITGYKKEQQRVFEQDRAVMLGARPPKREYVNYKTLQQQIQEKKQKAKEEIQPDTKKKKKQREKKKKGAAGSGSAASASGQVGRFKNGMLILSSKEIQKIKGRK
ncbi:uncharacterized protein FQA47_002459 [Oryzias melastigma]|uniref:Zgc:194224 n=1 Tax=Oryzias melastigma TaxID=30732 RepID=A0A3B3CTR9_ORYME|nr:uncharacterized protein C1orf131 homolog [Oryzias melastigma]KAF6735892.1 uncharacterized protein FQA47_002459 [Oryzias melastigma]